MSRVILYSRIKIFCFFKLLKHFMFFLVFSIISFLCVFFSVKNISVSQSKVPVVCLHRIFFSYSNIKIEISKIFIFFLYVCFPLFLVRYVLQQPASKLETPVCYSKFTGWLSSFTCQLMLQKEVNYWVKMEYVIMYYFKCPKQTRRSNSVSLYRHSHKLSSYFIFL